jgi:hypothetical protein
MVPTDIRYDEAKVYRIEALLQDKTSVVTASTATIRRRRCDAAERRGGSPL